MEGRGCWRGCADPERSVRASEKEAKRRVNAGRSRCAHTEHVCHYSAGKVMRKLGGEDEDLLCGAAPGARRGNVVQQIDYTVCFRRVALHQERRACRWKETKLEHSLPHFEGRPAD